MKHQKKFWKRFIPAVCAFLMVQAAFSHGSKDVEEINVETLESWQESFTLEGKKKGKYKT